jgi:outer membrane biosynthesis protein TonB
VMAKPMFPVSEEDQSSPRDADSPVLENLSSGKYDELFEGAPDKPSGLYHSAQIHAPTPSIRLLSSTPVEPRVFAEPKYPPIAKLAHIEGSVSFNVLVDSAGSVMNLSFESGSPLLQSAVKNASDGWKFPEDFATREIHAVIEFSLPCLPPPK